jgi:hypothetical protein
MKKGTTINPKELEGLEHKFSAFLNDVSLLRRHKRLYENLARSYGPHCTTLQWGEIPYSEAIVSAQKLCPNISAKQIGKSLCDLMIKIFEDQVVAENGTADYELKSITEVLDLSNMVPDICQMVSSLRKLARRQVILVPIEGLTMKVGPLEVGTVTFHSRSNTSELNQALKNIEEQYDGDTTSLNIDLKNVTCYARVEAVGDNEFVRNEAIQRTKKAIHILNLFISSTKHQPQWASIHPARIIINRALADNEHDAYSGACRPVIPIDVDHRFRCMSTTESD